MRLSASFQFPFSGNSGDSPFKEETMIKQTKKQMLMLAAIASIGLSAPPLSLRSRRRRRYGKGEIPYVIDARNVVARSGTGLCWRTGYWSPGRRLDRHGRQPPGRLRVRQGHRPRRQVHPRCRCRWLPRPAPKPSADKIKLAADALFDFDKAVLKPEGKAKLDELAAKSKSLKLEVILAVGHTDRIGSDAYNQKLSERAPPPSRPTWSGRASKPTASTPKARARSSP
jgi:OOP family OmpA-OmpF porin